MSHLNAIMHCHSLSLARARALSLSFSFFMCIYLSLYLYIHLFIYLIYLLISIYLFIYLTRSPVLEGKMSHLDAIMHCLTDQDALVRFDQVRSIAYGRVYELSISELFKKWMSSL